MRDCFVQGLWGLLKRVNKRIDSNWIGQFANGYLPIQQHSTKWKWFYLAVLEHSTCQVIICRDHRELSLLSTTSLLEDKWPLSSLFKICFWWEKNTINKAREKSYLPKCKEWNCSVDSEVWELCFHCIGERQWSSFQVLPLQQTFDQRKWDLKRCDNKIILADKISDILIKSKLYWIQIFCSVPQCNHVLWGEDSSIFLLHRRLLHFWELVFLV
jgi:hypothetical protein